MKTVLVLVGCLAISSSASAGGYLGLAVGTEPGVNDEFVRTIGPPSGRSLRALGGGRFGNLSIEGALNGFTIFTTRYGEQTVYQLSGALKLSIPLGNNFEAFARGGVERTWLDLGAQDLAFTGDGFLAGAGFEYRLNAVLANASLFVDYTVHHVKLDSAQFDTDATTRFWGIGLTVGI
jgi:hypothetical protein